MFFRCSFLNVPNVSPVKLVPMLTPVGNDCVVDTGYCSSITACFQQAMRWQWGAIDIGYVLVKCFRSGKVAMYSKLYAIWNIMEHHLLYPVFWVALSTIMLRRAIEEEYTVQPSLMDVVLFTVQTEEATYEITYHTVLLSFAVAFPLINWIMIVSLDYSLRYWILSSRCCFHCSPDYSKPLGCFSFLGHAWRATKLVLFPLADLLLFMLPTMLAHSKMFVNSDLVYVTAPKGQKKSGGATDNVCEATPLLSASKA
eukprot:SAG31_NODE_336_length_17493_cov_20.694032_6_plen_255_part_00